jgi:hypothetical protein
LKSYKTTLFIKFCKLHSIKLLSAAISARLLKNNHIVLWGRDDSSDRCMDGCIMEYRKITVEVFVLIRNKLKYTSKVYNHRLGAARYL